MNNTNIQERLPEQYLSSLSALNLDPAWTKLSSIVTPGVPHRNAHPALWRYADVKRHLLKAGELVSIEQAERRVLSFINPGWSRIAATPSMFLGMQLILPGERAPLHRHSPGAARIAVEGAGAFTTVEGAQLPMEEGDILLTPPHHWHDHIHSGTEPAIWMDVLDHPIVIPLEGSYIVEDRTNVSPIGNGTGADISESSCFATGMAPWRPPGVAAPRYPMMRFTWKRARESLIAAAKHTSAETPIHLMYINPLSGESILKTLCFSARLLRPKEEVLLPRNSASAVFHAIEGNYDVEVDGEAFECSAHDTVASPTFSTVRLLNKSTGKPALLLQVDDSPTQYSLGFYECELPQNTKGDR